MALFKLIDEGETVEWNFRSEEDAYRYAEENGYAEGGILFPGVTVEDYDDDDYWKETDLDNQLEGYRENME